MAAYPIVRADSGPEWELNLLTRKEFYSLKNSARNHRDPPMSVDPLIGKYLKIHAHQLFVGNFMNPDTPYKRLHLMHATGCHGAGTPIMMHDGSIKSVETIHCGDKLMGDDGTSRVVKSLAHGYDQMYAVTYGDGMFTCNSAHILTVIRRDHDAIPIDMHLSDWIAMKPSKQAEFCLYRAAVPRLGHQRRLRACLGGLPTVNASYTQIGPVEHLNDLTHMCQSLGYHVQNGNGCIHITCTAKPVPFTVKPIGIGEYFGFSIDGNQRYLLGDFIVTHNTGKTLASITIASKFIDVYRGLYTVANSRLQGRRNYAELDRTTPSVFVLGFGGVKGAFVRELMQYPDFGFITIAEKDEIVRLRRTADAGLPDDVKHLKEYYAHIKKRITSKIHGGFYKFFGYDEFVNRLFLSDEIKLTDLETEATASLRTDNPVTLEELVRKHIAEGRIQVNNSLLQMCAGSLIIADEVHNTYNMNMKNNRGVALQYILDTVPTVRFLSLSATPINNSPTECVELINYLVPTDQKITKKGFFSNQRTLLPGKLEEIGALVRGRISFLQDVNVKYFPKRVFVGELIPIPRSAGLSSDGYIPYLKFINCPMSEFHQATYTDYVRTMLDSKSSNITPDTADIDDIDLAADTSLSTEPYYAIPTNGYALYDIAFPNPQSDTIGIFRSAEVRSALAGASQEWRDKAMIGIKKFSALNQIIYGEFLKRDNISKYSTKNASLLDALFEIIASAGGDPAKCRKVMVYHNLVKMSGVLFIQELLRANGWIDEHSEPTDGTICVVCGMTLLAHAPVSTKEASVKTGHEFAPARFVIAHSDTDAAARDASLARYNNPSNAHGLNYMVLIASKIVKESYDFKDIQDLIIMSLPINIPTLIQVFGRCIRNNSHINLPPEQREVCIRIMLTTINNAYPSPSEQSPEMHRYIDKLLDYIVIQNIEREFHRNAIDADIHRDTIMSPSVLKTYFPDGDTSAIPINNIGVLYFEPAVKIGPLTSDQIIDTTFNAYKYYEQEIRTITYLIKRQFISTPVWTYDALWKTIRAPPFGVEMNPALFTEYNFIIALNNLITSANIIISAQSRSSLMTESMLVERLFDPAERYIYINGERHKIEQVGVYYILFPVANLPSNPLNTVFAEYTEHVRDKERMMIKELAEPADRVLVDVETYMRGQHKRPGIRINIDAFVRAGKSMLNYETLRARFIAGAENMNIYDFISEYSARFQMSFAEEAIIDVIKVGIENKSERVSSASIIEEISTEDSAVNDVVSDVRPIYKRVLHLLAQFRVIVTVKEVSKYRDVAKQFREGGLQTVASCTPIGYMTAGSVKLYNFTESPGKWIEVSKLSLNRHTAYKENDVIVGYLESAEDHMRFKLRKPIAKIKENIDRDADRKRMTKSEEYGNTRRTIVGDTRLIERGIVCGTKTKRDLLNILAALGVSVSKLGHSDIRIRRLCELIKSKLIENEVKERGRDSAYKYLYGWWDEAINLSAHV